KLNLVKWAPVFFPIAAFIVLPITSIMRRGFDQNFLDRFTDIYYSAEFSALQVQNDGFKYLGNEVLGYGNYLLSGVFIFIPRSIWPSKNSGTGTIIGELGYYPGTNVSVSPHFDAYLDFGVAGVFLWAI